MNEKDQGKKVAAVDGLENLLPFRPGDEVNETDEPLDVISVPSQVEKEGDEVARKEGKYLHCN